jgi:hypothetical protein
MVVMGRHIKRLEFLDIMLGDKSPLTPVESFYQRLLAGDADELQDQAERLLKDRSLSTYYDEVAIKGLQLAAGDAQRGALDSQQLDRVKGTVALLIRGLERHTDKQPTPVKTEIGPFEAPDSDKVPSNPDPRSVTSPRDQLPALWQSPSAILSIAGRGLLDELAAAMLGQLIGKHGLGSRLVSYSEVSRDQIDALDSTGVAMACISYLDIAGNPAHLRYLMQRLRQRLPRGTPILVGIWPAHDRTLTDRDVQTIIGADYLTVSLEQAVTACAEAALQAGGAAISNPDA